MTKQRNPRETFISEGVRGDAIYALREALDSKEIEEGEFLSQLFEKAVKELYGGGGESALHLFQIGYHRKLDREPC